MEAAAVAGWSVKGEVGHPVDDDGWREGRESKRRRRW